MIAKLDHIVIAVSDIERSNKFYRDVLGAEIIYHNGRYSYRIGGVVIKVHTADTKATPVAKNPAEPGSADLCFEWDDYIGNSIEYLRLRDVFIEGEIVERTGLRGKGNSIYFRDPDGALIEFISYRSAI